MHTTTIIKGSFLHEEIDLGYDNLGDASTKDRRIYVTPDGNKYPSITTVLGVLSRDFIEEWKKDVGEEEANRVTHHACTRGTALHDLLEDYLNNKDIDLNRVMPHVKILFNSAKSALDKRLTKVFLQEKPLYSDFFRVAGRVDLIGEFDGEISVIDFKTSKKPKTVEEIRSYFLQTAFYAAAFYERTNVPIRQTVIIMTVDGNKNPLIFKDAPLKWLPELQKTIKIFEKSL